MKERRISGQLTILPSDPKVRAKIRKHGKKVRAIFKIVVDAKGKMESARVLKSSGYPSYDPEKVTATFWKDVNPAFGVWRDPESEFRHVTACFDLVYRTNRHGMRDAERELVAEVPRVLVLGDSVVEGYGVAREARLSNLLERETGVPHLNFGTSGSFGPLQYRLLYETFASGFSHDSIILGIYPNNDLSDLLADPARKAKGERYRPYYVKESGEYRVVYRVETLEEAARAAEEGRFRRTFANVLREFVASVHVLRFMADVKPRHLAAFGGADIDRGVRSSFFDHTDQKIEVLLLSLDEIHRLKFHALYV